MAQTGVKRGSPPKSRLPEPPSAGSNGKQIMPKPDEGFGDASTTRSEGYNLSHLEESPFKAVPLFVNLQKPEPCPIAEIPALKKCLCDRLNIAGPPVMPRGPMNAEVIIVGRDPGEEETKHGEPFWPEAPGGRLLCDEYLPALGLTRDQVYITNALFCRGPDNKPPDADQKFACSHFHQQEFQNLKNPKYIIPLGTDAFVLMTGVFSSITPFVGQYLKTSFYNHKNVVIVPIHHPGYVVRRMSILNDMLSILKQMSGLE